ncbi:tripartite tricarboxylate transporter TctB family protein [Cognatishimia maritima]|uniref:Tripartite tricarboxylate transporter TctB family protein n=1 Tax=Cognatishimia maritima TaxID=870908 RepID=A0A1M5QQ66_9RHOB|nr:tripartite tricarboxylate transporter TctB family protein [Cognatishimia maritima]SHH16244.1 Tripartite tricarboxylate transporter TctB family protein [Cognatishimia maritima]
MKLDDLINGVVFLVLGIGIVAYAQSLPTMAQIEYGPGFLPSIVGTGMALAGAALIIARIWKNVGIVDGWFAFNGNGLRGLLGVGIFLAAIVFYILTADTFGFLIVAPILLFVIVYWFERRWKLAITVSIVGTFLLHTFFYQIMKAPLPWGILIEYSGALTW